MVHVYRVVIALTNTMIERTKGGMVMLRYLENTNLSITYLSRAVGFLVILFLMPMGLVGCGHGSYVTPSAPANFEGLGLSTQVGEMSADERVELTDDAIQRRLDVKPLASFPVNLAYARLQGGSRYSRDRTELVNLEDENTRLLFEPLGEQAGISGMTALNQMLLPADLQNERQLRGAAASLHADVMLLYTYDSRIETDEVIPYAGLFTLGLFPDRSAKAVVTASAIIVDVRSAYVYGVATGTGQRSQAASAWTNGAAIDDAIRISEQRATEELVVNLESLWESILDQHAPQLVARGND